MKILAINFLFLLITSVAFAQTPDKKQEKTKEIESGQLHHSDTSTRVISGSAQGKANGNSSTTEDSLKEQLSSDSVIVDQPGPKGR